MLHCYKKYVMNNWNSNFASKSILWWAVLWCVLSTTLHHLLPALHHFRGITIVIRTIQQWVKTALMDIIMYHHALLWMQVPVWSYYNSYLLHLVMLLKAHPFNRWRGTETVYVQASGICHTDPCWTAFCFLWQHWSNFRQPKISMRLLSGSGCFFSTHAT